MEAARPPALFVDLDGTLVATDLLWEGFVRAVRRQPWVLLLVPFWLLRGRAALKHALAQRAAVDPATLPYRADVLEFVRDRRRAGGRVVLATASARRWADDVAGELRLFDDVLASDAARNLKGSGKLEAILSYCKHHDVRSWGYVGDAAADCPIWSAADEIVMVAPSRKLVSRVAVAKESARIIGERVAKLRPALKAMRPHQWAKNALLFVPLILARAFDNPAAILVTLAAFASFSLCASAVYVLNDLFDVEADRAHPRKRRRPFAAGTLPLAYGPPMAVALAAAAFGLAVVALPLPFVITLIVYLGATSLYTAVLKRQLLVDVLALAGLYTLRVFAGGAATDLPVSQWLLAFSIFMFTSLAVAKRYVEVARLADTGQTETKGRGYQVGDLDLLQSFGLATGCLAVVIFALYINSGLPVFYTQAWMLWLTCPLLLYWIARLWFLARRGQLHDDPVVFAITDKVSIGIGVTVGALVLLAAHPW